MIDAGRGEDDAAGDGHHRLNDLGLAVLRQRLIENFQDADHMVNSWLSI